MYFQYLLLIVLPLTASAGYKFGPVGIFFLYFVAVGLPALVVAILMHFISKSLLAKFPEKKTWSVFCKKLRNVALYIFFLIAPIMSLIQFLMDNF